MQKGNISVQTENIFPIIKQFLYSDQEIFLRELISNAVDATNKLKTLSSKGEFKGEIGDTTIEIILDKENKTLTIRDKGIGMTEETRAAIFEAFHQADNSSTRQYGGAGLGLTIALDIVRDHGGVLEHRVPPDGGCCFAVQLPVANRASVSI